ncbi:hypothetical protein B0H10DRAFT_2231149 [Mycena sp. CBHHK59/15]|nr:hypothetical protein B0H10DRAFT_2231149 [Mycena sp. CBHHK59/15]
MSTDSSILESANVGGSFPAEAPSTYSLSQFNFGFNMSTDSSILDSANVGGLFPTEAPSADPSTFQFTFDPTHFSIFTDFDVAIPSGALSEDPLQAFLNSYGMSDDQHTTANFVNVPSVGPFIYAFPMLPPPW